MKSGDDKSNDSGSSEGDSDDLNPTSERYKPQRVLYSRKAPVPVPSAKPYDNVSVFEAQFRLLGGYRQRFDEGRLNAIRQANSKAAGRKLPNASELPQRKFEPHQGMIKREKPAKFKKNIFMKLENMEGPLVNMAKWMRERVRVKVYTRKEKGIRGYVTGYIEVFDKHWNMALTDVYESWKRRKYRYSESKLCSLGEPQDCSGLLLDMGIHLPKVSVKSLDRKYVMCSRRIPKLIVRGEQVVLVTPDTALDVNKEEDA